MTSWPLLASALLMLGAWLVSNHYPPWVTAHSELLSALALGALWLGALSAGKRRRIALPASAVFLLAMAAVPPQDGRAFYRVASASIAASTASSSSLACSVAWPSRVRCQLSP